MPFPPCLYSLLLAPPARKPSSIGSCTWSSLPHRWPPTPVLPGKMNGGPQPTRRCPSVTRASSQTRRGAASPRRSATVARHRIGGQCGAEGCRYLLSCWMLPCVRPRPAGHPTLPLRKALGEAKRCYLGHPKSQSQVFFSHLPPVSTALYHLLFIPQRYPPLACVHAIPRCFSLCWGAFIPHSGKQFVDTAGHKNVLGLTPMSFKYVTNYRGLFNLTNIYKNRVRICFCLLDWQYLLLSESLSACEEEGENTFSYTF